MRLAEVLHFATKELQTLSEPPQEARELLRDVLNISLTELVLNSDRVLTEEQQKKVLDAVQRRKDGEPLAYIVKKKDFYKYSFIVSEEVLIPRSETALLVEEILRDPTIKTVIDLGSGSGCIVLSLLKDKTDLKGWAIEKSPGAAEILRKNAEALDVAQRLSVCVQDVMELDLQCEVDVVVSNPPYITTEDARLDRNVRKYEPALALYAGDKGLQYYKLWTPWAQRHLKKGGRLLYEVGQGQAPDVASICLQNGFKNIKIVKDLAGIERVVVGTKD